MTSEKHDLDELSLRYRRLFEAAQDGILLLDFPDGRIEDANPYILNILGYSHDEVLGKQLWELGLLADRKKAEEVQRKIVVEGYARFEDIELVSKSGKTIPVEFIANSYRVDGVTVIQCNIREISERKQAEVALAQEQTKITQQMYEVIDSLSNVIEARDPYTAGHQKRVTDLSVAIAHEMKLAPSLIDGIRFASQVHDIGKISIPTEILTKPSALTSYEIAMLRSHAQAGYEILKPLSFPWPVADIILQHHERLDGSGYPNALMENDILVEAKIIAVADTVEAMSSDRPYRSTKGIDHALEEIETNSGVLYDQEAVKACLDLFRNKGYRFPEVYHREFRRL
ncbi:MAG: HD-GYP domain-containing protein [Fluviibacter sp.]